jgi:flagellar biosynthesis regulator FlbT
MPLKLRLKRGDRLIVNSAYLEVERVGKANVYVSVEAPQEVAVMIRRKTACEKTGDDVQP